MKSSARVKKTDTAFQPKTESLINQCIDALCKRVMRTVAMPNITVKEMLSLTAPREFHNFLLNGRQMADLPRYISSESDPITITTQRGRKVSVAFKYNISGDTAPLMPRQPMWLDHFPENRELAKTLTAAAQQYADIAIDFGIVRTVFNELNTLCKKPEQMRYFWPAILGIMAVGEELSDWRSILTPLSVPRVLPTLPLKVRELCKQTATTIAMASLLPPLERESTVTPNVWIKFDVESGAVNLNPGDMVPPIWTYAVNP